MSGAELPGAAGDVATGAELSPLSGASQELLVGYRAATTPVQATLDGVWVQLRADIDAGMAPQLDAGGAATAGGEAAAAGGPVAGAGVAPWAGVVVGLGLVAIGALVVVLVSGGSPEHPSSARAVPVVDDSRDPVRAPAIVSLDEDGPRQPELLESPEVLKPATPATPATPAIEEPRARASHKHRAGAGERVEPRVEPEVVELPSAEPAPASGNSLADERALLERVRRELAGGRVTAAEGLLDRFDERFAAPVLAEERDVLEIRALCLGGDEAGAQARATRFGGRYPLSAHTPQLLRACE